MLAMGSAPGSVLMPSADTARRGAAARLFTLFTSEATDTGRRPRRRPSRRPTRGWPAGPRAGRGGQPPEPWRSLKLSSPEVQPCQPSRAHRRLVVATARPWAPRTPYLVGVLERLRVYSCIRRQQCDPGLYLVAAASCSWKARRTPRQCGLRRGADPPAAWDPRGPSAGRWLCHCRVGRVGRATTRQAAPGTPGRAAPRRWAPQRHTLRVLRRGRSSSGPPNPPPRAAVAKVGPTLCPCH